MKKKSCLQLTKFPILKNGMLFVFNDSYKMEVNVHYTNLNDVMQ